MEKALKIVVKQYALDQLKEEYDFYTTEYSVGYAEKFRLSFFDEAENILPHYKSFPECRFLLTKNKAYRNVIWGNYLIVFKIRATSIDILSLFHTKRNPMRLKKLRRIH